MDDRLSTSTMRTILDALTTTTETEALLEALGFDHTESGSFKHTFTHDDYSYVVKVLHYAPEHGACEIENANTAPEWIQPMLLPILEHGRHYMIQKRAYGSDCKGRDCPLHVADVNDMCFGRNHVHTSDGRIEIYDYGQFGQWDDVCDEYPDMDSAKDEAA